MKRCFCCGKYLQKDKKSYKVSLGAGGSLVDYCGPCADEILRATKSLSESSFALCKSCGEVKCLRPSSICQACNERKAREFEAKVNREYAAIARPIPSSTLCDYGKPMPALALTCATCLELGQARARASGWYWPNGPGRCVRCSTSARVGLFGVCDRCEKDERVVLAEHGKPPLSCGRDMKSEAGHKFRWFECRFGKRDLAPVLKVAVDLAPVGGHRVQGEDYVPGAADRFDPGPLNRHVDRVVNLAGGGDESRRLAWITFGAWYVEWRMQDF